MYTFEIACQILGIEFSSSTELNEFLGQFNARHAREMWRMALNEYLQYNRLANSLLDSSRAAEALELASKAREAEVRSDFYGWLAHRCQSLETIHT